MAEDFSYALTPVALPLTPPTELLTESAMLLAVDMKRNELQMQQLTRGTSTILEYAEIQAEFADYSSLTAALIAAVRQTEQRVRWPIASIEAELTGKTLATLMAGYGVAIATAEKSNRVYGRIAVNGKAKIRAATTLAGKRAAFFAINWNWKPSF